MAHKSQKLQFEIVAVLGLLSPLSAARERANAQSVADKVLAAAMAPLTRPRCPPP